jgi:hypothetical protein
MSVNHPFRTMAAAIGLCASVTPLHAAMLSSASLQNFSIAVEDLTPNDGIQAGYTFAGMSQQGHVLSWSSYSAPGEGDSTFASGWHDVALQSSSGASTAASSAGNGFIATSGSGLYTAFMNRSAGISMLPNTRLLISADVQLSASIDSLACEPLCQRASAQLLISAPGVFTRLEHVAVNPFGETSRTVSIPVSFTFENSSLSLVERSISMSVESGGALVPIPEPSTYALMLAGLGVVAWTRRRRLAGRPIGAPR